MTNPVQRRIAHVEIGRRHVDLRAQDVRAVREFSRAHPREQRQILLDGSIAVRTVPSRLGQRAAVGANLVGIQAVDVGLPLLDQRDGKLVELLEVVGRIELGVPREAQPLDVFLDGVDILDVFLGRVRVVEAEVADAAPLLGDAEVQADGLRVSDVKIAVRFRRKPRRHAPMVLPGREILVHDGADEVDGWGRGGRSMVVAHMLGLLYVRLRHFVASARQSPSQHLSLRLCLPAGGYLLALFSRHPDDHGLRAGRSRLVPDRIGGFTYPVMPGLRTWLLPLTT